MFDTLNTSTLVHMGKVTLNGTAAVASSLVDMQGYNALDIGLVTGTITDAGTASGYTVKLQHSDTTVAGDFADVVAADAVNGVVSVTNTLDADDDKLIGRLGYVGTKRYVRVVATGTSGSAGDVHPIARASRSGLSRPNAAITAATAAT
jgi:hypothetical protein